MLARTPMRGMRENPNGTIEYEDRVLQSRAVMTRVARKRRKRNARHVHNPSRENPSPVIRKES
jgi:hypothetical protein